MRPVWPTLFGQNIHYCIYKGDGCCGDPGEPNHPRHGTATGRSGFDSTVPWSLGRLFPLPKPELTYTERVEEVDGSQV